MKARSKRFRWPPKDSSDIQCQDPAKWLNEADIPQELYDILLVIIGKLHYEQARNYEQHLQILRLEKVLADDIRGVGLGAPLIAPFQPQYEPRDPQ